MRVHRLVVTLAGFAVMGFVVASAVLLAIWGLDGGLVPPWGVH